jgi:hypothetical protein
MLVDMALDEMNTTSKAIKDELENFRITVSQNTLNKKKYELSHDNLPAILSFIPITFELTQPQ